MQRSFSSIILALLTLGAVPPAFGFSLLGLSDTWQTAALGYGYAGSGDVTGYAPLNLTEEYRWNIRSITYGFDQSFVDYFGQQGIDAVSAAVNIINDLPSVSQLSSNLVEFATDTQRINYSASALGVIDMKTATLGLLLEQLGLASAEQYVWTLRGRQIVTVGGVTTTNYLVIKRNFDPVLGGSSPAPSSYVNDVLYTYTVREFVNPTFADAIETTVDPLAIGFTSVSMKAKAFPTPGIFVTGLTRDDVGGLRYIYRTSNIQRENLIPGTLGGSPNPWDPIGTTNAVVNIALRPGIDKITFTRGVYDSLVGSFLTVTNNYTDLYITNSTVHTQQTRRALIQPDILFTAEDLGQFPNSLQPIPYSRSIAAVNNNAINGQPNQPGPGPGIFQPQTTIRFSKLGPYFFNSTPYFLDEANAGVGVVWGSYDGSTNPPVIFPNYYSVQQLEQQILSGN